MPDDRARRAIGQRGRVIGIVYRIARAIGAGQRGAARADDEKRYSLCGGNLCHGDVHTGIGPSYEHIQAVLVGPLAKFRCADVGLVLMIGAEHDDFLAEDRAPGVGDGHMDGLDAALPLNIRIDSR